MKRILATFFCFTVAACVATPPVEPQVRETGSASLGLAPASAPPLSERWWTAFGDPQLDRLVAQALADNPTLAIALARLRTAQADISASRASTYPQVSFDANEQRDRLSANYIIPPPYGGSFQWIGTVQGNLAWSLDVFGKQDAELARLHAAAEGATLNATAARLALAGAVTQGYIALARAYVLVDVAADAVKQRQGILGLTATQVSNGLEAKGAENLAAAQAAQAEAELVRVQGLVDLAVHQLATLTGHGAEAYNLARPLLKADTLALPDVLPADMLARRADIAAAKARVQAATAGREQARLAFYPDINLVATAGWAALGLSDLFNDSSLQYGGGAAIHLPIFDAGTLRARYAGATAMLDETVAAYNANLLTAVQQTADALSMLRSLNAQMAPLQRMRESADASLDFAARRYKSGLSPQLPVLTAEDLVIQARRQNAVLSTDIASARVALVMALGGGFSGQPIPSHQDESHE